MTRVNESTRGMLLSWRILGCLCAAAPAALGGVVASAADATASTGASVPGTSLQEIVVTATKRQTTVQNTPMTITAITGDQLANRGLTNLEDTIRNVPGVSVRSAGPGQVELEMRGLASSGGAAPTVGYYLDDVVLTPPIDPWSKPVVDTGMYDLARVEVLQGPQGTLYGGGSMGGTIRLITNPPSLDEFYGNVDVGASGTVGGNRPNGTANGMLNIPLVTGKLALRIVAGETYDSGWISRIVLNPFPLPTSNGCNPGPWYGCARGDVVHAPVQAKYPGTNWLNSPTARAELLFQPSDAVKSSSTFLYSSVDQGGSNFFDNPPGPKYMAHYQPYNVPEPYTDRFYLADNDTTVDLGRTALTVVTAYWIRQQKITQDTGEAYQNLFLLPSAPADPYEINPGWNDARQFTEEVRLASRGDTRFQWLVGTFYENLHSLNRSFTEDPLLCGFSNGGCPANPMGIIFNAYYDYGVMQYAGFGNMSYKFTPTLSATVGARYFHYNNSLGLVYQGFFTPSGNAASTNSLTQKKNTGVVPKVDVSYQPSRNLNLYGTVSEGFRPGGANQVVPVTGPGSCLPGLQAIGLQQAPEGFGPDDVWSYEVGEKWRSPARFSLNSDFYYNKWKSIQQLLTLPCGFGYTANAGTAATYGPEIQAALNIMDGFTAELSGTYTHAKLTQVIPGSGFSVGQQILNIPQYQVDASLSYSRTMKNDVVMTMRADDSFVGRNEDVAYGYVWLPSYNLLNLRLQLDYGSRTLALYVNNVTNKHAWITANNTGLTVNIPDLDRISTNQPLTAGLEYRFRF